MSGVDMTAPSSLCHVLIQYDDDVFWNIDLDLADVQLEENIHT